MHVNIVSTVSSIILVVARLIIALYVSGLAENIANVIVTLSRV